MLSTQEKRKAVANAYPSHGWKQRVKNMADNQVHVIYMRLINAGKL